MKKYISVFLAILCSISICVHAENEQSPSVYLEAVEIASNMDGLESLSEGEDKSETNAEADESESPEEIKNISLLNLGTSVEEEWSQVAGLNESRADCNTAVINGELYVIGGISHNGYLDSIEKYNDKNDKWEYVTAIPNAPKGYAVAVYDDNIYIIGGYVNGAYLRDVQVYNVTSNTWGTINRMKRPRVQAAAVAADDRIYVFGGRDAFGLVKSYEYYDFEEEKWILVTAGYDSSLVRIAAGAVYINGYICVYGGRDVHGNEMGAGVYPLSDLGNARTVLSGNYERVFVVSGNDKAMLFAIENYDTKPTVKEIVVSGGSVDVNNVSINDLIADEEYASYVIYNGYIYRIGGYASREYSNNVYKYSVYYGDFSVGGGQTGSNQTEYGSDLILNVETGHEYLIFLNVKNMPNLNAYEFAIEYTDDSFSVNDTCAFTQYNDRIQSSIIGTDLKVTKIGTNGMSFVTSEIVPDGKTVTKTINVVKLKATSSGQRTIKYSMTKK